MIDGLRFLVTKKGQNADSFHVAAVDYINTLESHVAALEARCEKMKEALDTEELEGEFGANDTQGGLFNGGASSILRRWIDHNKAILSDLERGPDRVSCQCAGEHCVCNIHKSAKGEDL